ASDWAAELRFGRRWPAADFGPPAARSRRGEARSGPTPAHHCRWGGPKEPGPVLQGSAFSVAMPLLDCGGFVALSAAALNVWRDARRGHLWNRRLSVRSPDDRIGAEDFARRESRAPIAPPPHRPGLGADALWLRFTPALAIETLLPDQVESARSNSRPGKRAR